MEAKYGLSRDFIFKDAVRFLKGKRALTSEEYRLLDDESRAKAFTVSGYTSLQMLQEFLDCHILDIHGRRPALSVRTERKPEGAQHAKHGSGE